MLTKNKKTTGKKITEIALTVVIVALFVIVLIMANEEPPNPLLGEGTHPKVPKLMPIFMFFFFIAFPILAFKVALQDDGNKNTVPDDITSMIILISLIMNADGEFTNKELDEVKPFLREKFGEKRTKKLLLLLNEKLQKDIRNVRPHCARVKRLFSYPQRLEFMTLLFRIAEANGEICQYEAETLRNIAHYTSIDDSDFIGLTHEFSIFYNYQKKQAQVVYYDTGWAYQVLQIEENASMDVIKKAYRKLVMQHHPDKVSPHNTAAQEQAAEKFRRINEAYKLLEKRKQS